MSVDRVVGAGEVLDVELDGFGPRSTVHLALESVRGTRATPTIHRDVTIAADGSARVAAPTAASDLDGVLAASAAHRSAGRHSRHGR